MENKETKIDFNDSVELYQEIISSDDSNLMVKASNYYLHRRSFVDFFESINFEERSLKLLEKAVELNNSNAMLILGNIHRFGTDYVGKHPAYANDLYYTGAELGMLNVCLNSLKCIWMNILKMMKITMKLFFG